MEIFILTLCAIMQFKHFICDYLLQTQYMLGKFAKEGWVKPLLAHVGVHGVWTFIFVTGLVGVKAGLLATLLDMIVHFVMDRIKASPDLLGRFTALSKSEFKGLAESYAMVKGAATHYTGDIQEQGKIEVERIEARFKSNTYFWYALGLDQLVHHLTDLAIVYIIVVNYV